MKRLFLLAAAFLFLTLHAPAQSVTAAIDELAALRTLRQTVQQGYKTVSAGLTNIGVIRTAEYQLHTDYITGLDSVRPAITADPKLHALLVQLSQLITQLQSSLDYWQKQSLSIN
jgi:hypothetical protein